MAKETRHTKLDYSILGPFAGNIDWRNADDVIALARAMSKAIGEGLTVYRRAGCKQFKISKHKFTDNWRGHDVIMFIDVVKGKDDVPLQVDA